MLHSDVLQRPLISTDRINLVNALENVQPLNNLAKDRVFILELSNLLPIRPERHKERACVHMRPFIRCRHQASFVKLSRPNLVLEKDGGLFLTCRSCCFAPNGLLNDRSARISRKRVKLLHLHNEVFLHESH